MKERNIPNTTFAVTVKDMLIAFMKEINIPNAKFFGSICL